MPYNDHFIIITVHTSSSAAPRYAGRSSPPGGLFGLLSFCWAFSLDLSPDEDEGEDEEDEEEEEEGDETLLGFSATFYFFLLAIGVEEELDELGGLCLRIFLGETALPLFSAAMWGGWGAWGWRGRMFSFLGIFNIFSFNIELLLLLDLLQTFLSPPLSSSFTSAPSRHLFSPHHVWVRSCSLRPEHTFYLLSLFFVSFGMRVCLTWYHVIL